MHWTHEYIGIPFTNMNCGELALCIQREVFGKKLIPLQRPDDRNPFHYSRLVKENVMNYLKEKIDVPLEGCCVLMKAMNRLSHVGVYSKINKRDYVIHSMDSFKSSVLHQIKDLKTYGYEVEGYYTWK